MESKALGLGARNMCFNKLTQRFWCSNVQRKLTQMPGNRGRRGGRELKRNTWSLHLQTWPCLLQGRLPMPRKRKQSLGQVCRKESSFPPQDVVAEAPAFSFQLPGGEAPPEFPPATARLFCLPNIKKDKTPYFSSMQASQMESAMISELVFLKVWGLCISGTHWSPVPPNQNLWGFQEALKITPTLCRIWVLFYFFGLTWHLVWDEVSEYML